MPLTNHGCQKIPMLVGLISVWFDGKAYCPVTVLRAGLVGLTATLWLKNSQPELDLGWEVHLEACVLQCCL